MNFDMYKFILLLSFILPIIFCKHREPARKVIHAMFRYGPDFKNGRPNIIKFRENKVSPPPEFDGSDRQTHETLNMEVKLRFINIDAVNMKRMTISSTIMFMFRWMDERLIWVRKIENVYEITEFKEKLWLPDIHFPQIIREKSIMYGSSPDSCYMSKDGLVTWIYVKIVEFTCPMTVEYFPFDKQTCYFDLILDKYKKKDINFSWWMNERYDPYGITPQQYENNTRGIIEPEESTLSEFAKPIFRKHECISNLKGFINSSCLRVTILFKRNSHFYLIYGYLPSLGTVTFGWLSTFLHNSYTQARITVIMFSSLTLITQLSTLDSSLPNLPKIKSYDVWFFGCLALISLLAAEFSLVNYLNNRIVIKTTKKLQKLYKIGAAGIIDFVQNDCEFKLVFNLDGIETKNISMDIVSHEDATHIEEKMNNTQTSDDDTRTSLSEFTHRRFKWTNGYTITPPLKEAIRKALIEKKNLFSVSKIDLIIRIVYPFLVLYFIYMYIHYFTQ